jgi:hypothetical protein
VISVFTAMWGQLETNKQVGGLFPNDGDGNAWGDPNVGFPPVLAKLGYGLVDPGRYQNLTDDFSAQINAFKQANVEIVTGVPIPPDFTTFWNQAKQQGFTPESGVDWQGDPVPAGCGSIGRCRQQPLLGGMVVPEPSVQVLAQRPEFGRRSGRRLFRVHQQAVDPADRLRACAVRAGYRCHGPGQRRGRQ